MSDSESGKDMEPVFLAPKLPQRKSEAEVPSRPPVFVDDYTPPSWAEVPPASSDYTMEVMNNGVVTFSGQLKLLVKNRSYLTVGRADICDIKVGIPGASRLHCYLQYGEAFDGRGWYVLDKNSTHRTYVNKQELPRNVYYKAKPGSVIQITKANFHIFLTGTSEAEGRSAAPLKPDVVKQENTEVKLVKQYEKDPVAALKGFCEREGLDFEFDKDVKSKDGKREFTCSFELPDNICGGEGGTFSGVGDSLQNAQIECARQACVHLDGLGMLTSGINWNKHGTREDFLDEDEDEFFDRTGQIEQQRLKRKQRFNKEMGISDKALTHSEILDKLKTIEEKKATIAGQLQRILKPVIGTTVSSEEINVATLNASISIRLEVSRLKKKLQEACDEYKVLAKAEEVARPTQLKLNEAPKPAKEIVLESKHADTVLATTKVTKEAMVAQTSLDMEPAEKQSDGPLTSENERDKTPSDVCANPSTSSIYRPSPKTNSEPVAKSAQKIGRDGKKYGLLSRTELHEQEANVKQKRRTEQDLEEEVVLEKRNKSESKKEFEEPVWVPPSGQTGDGRTSLNDKLGY